MHHNDYNSTDPNNFYNGILRLYTYFV